MMSEGYVRKGIGGFYYVQTQNGIIECRAKGAFRNNNISPFPGDHVTIVLEDEAHGNIEEIHPRKNFFQRPTVANIDQLILVVSATEPEPNPLVLDKMLAIAEYKEIDAFLIVTKTDLKSAERLINIYCKAGYDVLISSPDDASTKEILNRFKGKISVLCGNSGVGKSTMINRLFPDLSVETSKISQKLGRGRHTTRQTELFPVIGGGYIADTPGFSTVDIGKYEVIRKEDVQYSFREFAPFIDHCQFTGCSHTKEKGCAVLKALEEGLISKSRHESYCMLYDDAKKIKEWELK